MTDPLTDAALDAIEEAAKAWPPEAKNDGMGPAVATSARRRRESSGRPLPRVRHQQEHSMRTCHLDCRMMGPR
jgi:hypothetical protein